MFITFEGPDGSGKTTALKFLIEKLEKIYPNLKYIVTREPGGKNIPEAEAIRQIILDNKSQISEVSEALLYTTSRRIHLERVIWPNLKNNVLVLCDRYVDSFYAYQGFARNLGIDYAKKLTNLVIDKTMPDITIFFDIHPKDALKRVNNLRLEKNRLDNEDLQFHNRVYQGYLKLVKEDKSRFIIVDANQKVEKVVQDIFNYLIKNKKFKKYLSEVNNGSSKY